MEMHESELKKIILNSGLISKTDLEEIQEKNKGSKEKFASLLLSSGKINEKDLKRIEAQALGIPFIDLASQKIDFETLSMVPEPIARNHNIITYKKSDSGLEVAMLDVDDLYAIDFIKKKTGLKILPRLTDSASLKTALVQYKQSLEAEFSDLIKKNVKDVKPSSESETEEDLKKIAEDLPVVKIVDSLIEHAILQGASDIHIEPGEHDLIVRYRIDGILHDAMTLDKEAGNGITARIKVLSNLKLDEKRLPQDGRFKIENGEQKVSFRVSTLPTFYGEKTVMRVLNENAHGFTLEGLGFHGQGLELIHESLKQRTGMVLATGPTGSGKTTTLYTALDMLNTPGVNISTVEDPIEYQMPRVNQTQIRSEIGLTFSNGLRALLRQDPDIVMVGEIRDGETASLAVNASLTGHLVLSTIHTNSAAGAIPRMIDIGVLPFLIVSTVKTVISQRLVRKLSSMEGKYFMSQDEMKSLAKLVDLDRILNFLKIENIVAPDATWDKIPLYKVVKTNEFPDGYKGRLGIHEVLKVSLAIKELIIKGASADEIEKQAKSEGMMTMLEDGIFQAVRGMTTVEEVLRVVSE